MTLRWWRSLAVASAALLAAAAPVGAAPPAPDGGDVYVGTTDSGQTVRFLVTRQGTRIGDFSFGNLPAECGHYDASMAGFFRVRPGGRFRDFGEIPSGGSEHVTVEGRLRGGRASGTVIGSSRVDCLSTQERWRARRVRVPEIATRSRLRAGPRLAGSRVVWGEQRDRPQLLLLGGGARRSRVVARLARATGLSASPDAIAFARDGLPHAGPLLGPFPKLSGCPSDTFAAGPAPSVDGGRVLYEEVCEGVPQLRLRDLSSGSDVLLARWRVPSVGLRLAGDFIAAINVDLVYVFRRSALHGQLIEGTAGAAYTARRPALADDFDLQRDGKLVVKPLLGASEGALEWYSPSEPQPHVVGSWEASHPLIEGDRIVYRVRDPSDSSISGTWIEVASLNGESFGLATFSRGPRWRSELVGGLDFNGTRVTFASRTRRLPRGRYSPVRIETLPIGGENGS